jgi:hypothetical protein
MLSRPRALRPIVVAELGERLHATTSAIGATSALAITR